MSTELRQPDAPAASNVSPNGHWYDGIAQSSAVVAGDLDERARRVIDEEIARIGSPSMAPSASGVDRRRVARPRRGVRPPWLNVVVEQSARAATGPDRTPTVTEIVREALNSVAKHTDRRSARSPSVSRPVPRTLLTARSSCA